MNHSEPSYSQLAGVLIRYLYAGALITALTPVYCHAETGKEQYLEIGERCATAHDPGACMESYGFSCHQGRVPHRSVEAQLLGCNLDLGDGRMHFVQMLYDDGGWNIETEKTYRADYSDATTPEQESELALTSYIHNEMKGYSSHSSGGGTTGSHRPQLFETGARRIEGRVAVRAVCGSIVQPPPAKDVLTDSRTFCEGKLQRTVRKLSQSQSKGPYRVAGPSEFDWESRTATLVSGDSALIWEGHYRFSDQHVPCLWISGCCSTDGQLYLGSCRAPTDGELKIVDKCLGGERAHRSGEFLDCLREAGMSVGCEDQADGSQICQ